MALGILVHESQEGGWCLQIAPHRICSDTQQVLEANVWKWVTRKQNIYIMQ